MNVRTLATLLLAAGVAAMASNACARQPVRDLIRERMAERRAQAVAEGRRPRLRQAQAPTAGTAAPTGRDLAYGPDPAHLLDVYRPASASGAPVVFMVHGGGWQRGDKAAPSVTGAKFDHWLGKGHVVVSVNYRLDGADPLQQADDVARALAFAQQHAASWGGDPSRFVLVGHSAGAHLVSLLASDPALAARHGAQPWRGTVALDSAAYDVVAIMESRHLRLYDRAFGDDRELWRAASPTLRIERAPAPMLLACSSRREDACRQAEGFARRVRELGGNASVLPLDLSHMEINARLGEPGAYTDAVSRFLASVLGD